LSEPDTHLIIDVGGDDRGAVALGRYTPDIINDNYEMFFVANCYRPLTKTAEDAYEIMKEIEVASKLPFTAIVNNSNIGDFTTDEDIKKSEAYINKLSDLSGLPVKMTTSIREVDVKNNFIIKLQSKYYAV
jgi:hypothetical protein